MILTDTQQVVCTIDPRNAKGNPAPVDGVPEWATSNPSVATVHPTADGMACTVRSVGVGTCQISVTADADLDVGEVRNITGTLDIDVRPSEAVTMGITTGIPQEQ